MKSRSFFFLIILGTYSLFVSNIFAAYNPNGLVPPGQAQGNYGQIPYQGVTPPQFSPTLQTGFYPYANYREMSGIEPAYGRYAATYCPVPNQESVAPVVPPIAQVSTQPMLFGSWTTISGQKVKIPLQEVDEARMNPKSKETFNIFASYGPEECNVTHFFGQRTISQCVAMARQLDSKNMIEWWNAKCQGRQSPQPNSFLRLTTPSPVSDSGIDSVPSSARMVELDAAKAELEKIRQQVAEDKARAAAEIEEAKQAAIAEINRLRNQRIERPAANVEIALPQRAAPAKKGVSHNTDARGKLLLELVTGSAADISKEKLADSSTQSLASGTAAAKLTITEISSKTEPSSEQTGGKEKARTELQEVGCTGQPATTSTINEPTPQPVGSITSVTGASVLQSPAARVPVSSEQKPQKASKPNENKKQKTQTPQETTSQSRDKKQGSATLDSRKSVAAQPQPAPVESEAKQVTSHSENQGQEWIKQRNTEHNLERHEWRNLYGQEPKKEKQNEQSKKDAARVAVTAKNTPKKGNKSGTVSTTDDENELNRAVDEAENQLLEYLKSTAKKRNPIPPTTKEEQQKFGKALDQARNGEQRKAYDFLKTMETPQSLIAWCAIAEKIKDWETADAIAFQIERGQVAYDLSSFYVDRAMALLERLQNKEQTGQNRKKFIGNFEVYRKRIEATGDKGKAQELLFKQIQEGFHPEHQCCSQTKTHPEKKCAHTLALSFEDQTPTLLYEQALCLLHGWGTPVDKDKGQLILEKASRLGEKQAQIALGKQGIGHPEIVEEWITKKEQSFLNGYVLACIQNPGDQFQNCDEHFQKLFGQLCDQAKRNGISDQRHTIRVLEMVYDLVLNLEKKRSNLDSYFNPTSKKQQSPQKKTQLETLVKILDYGSCILPGTLDQSNEERMKLMRPAEKQAYSYAQNYANTLRQQFPFLAPSFFFDAQVLHRIFPPLTKVANCSLQVAQEGTKLQTSRNFDFMLKWFKNFLSALHLGHNNQSYYESLASAERRNDLKQAFHDFKMLAADQEKKQKALEVLFQLWQIDEQTPPPKNSDPEKKLKELKEYRIDRIRTIEDLRKDSHYAAFRHLLNAYEALMYLDGIHPDQYGMSDEQKEMLIKEKAVNLINGTALPEGPVHSLFNTARGRLLARRYSVLPDIKTEHEQLQKAIELLVASIDPACFQGTCDQTTCFHNPYAQRTLAHILWDKEKQAIENRHSRVEELLVTAQCTDLPARGFLMKVFWKKALQLKDAQRLNWALQLWQDLKEKQACPRERRELAEEISEETINVALEMIKQHRGNQDTSSVSKKVQLSLQIQSFCDLCASRCSSEQRDALLAIIEKLRSHEDKDLEIFFTADSAQASLIEPVARLYQFAQQNGQSLPSEIQARAYQNQHPTAPEINTPPHEIGLYIYRQLSSPTIESIKIAEKELKKVGEGIIPEHFLMLLKAKVGKKVLNAPDINQLPVKELFSLLHHLSLQSSLVGAIEEGIYQKLAQARKDQLIVQLKNMPTIPDIIDFMMLHLKTDSYCLETDVIDANKLFPFGPQLNYAELINTAQKFADFALAEFQSDRFCQNSEIVTGPSPVFECVCKSVARGINDELSFETFDTQEFEDYCHAIMFFMQGLVVSPFESTINSLKLAQLMVEIKHHNVVLNKEQPLAYARVEVLLTGLCDTLVFLVDKERQKNQSELADQAIKLLQQEGLQEPFMVERVEPTYKKSILETILKRFAKPLNFKCCKPYVWQQPQKK